MEFPGELDYVGNVIENNFTRRLYRVLNLPTADLTHNKEKFNLDYKLRRRAN